MGLDLLPPISAILAAFAHEVVGEHRGRGAAVLEFDGVWLPARIEQMPISDTAVTDLMACLAIPRTHVPTVREGDWVRIPTKGSTVPHVWTVRRVYDNDDGGFAICGVVPTGAPVA